MKAGTVTTDYPVLSGMFICQNAQIDETITNCFKIVT